MVSFTVIVIGFSQELHIADRLDRMGARKYRGAKIARYLILIGKRGGVKFCLVKRGSVI